MKEALKRISQIFIASGILIGSSYYSAKYIESSLKELIVESTNRAMRHPIIQDKFQDLSEKMIGKVLTTPSSQEIFFDLTVRMITNPLYRKMTFDHISRAIGSEEVNFYATPVFTQVINQVAREFIFIKNKEIDIKPYIDPSKMP